MQKRDVFCERHPLIFSDAEGEGGGEPQLGHRHWLYQLLYFASGEQYTEMMRMMGSDEQAAPVLTFVGAKVEAAKKANKHLAAK